MHTGVQKFLEGITASGEVLMEALARIVEYLATFATIYLILEVGIKQLQAFPIPHSVALGIILSSPELVMIGAYNIATREIAHGNKAGWALLASVGVLLLLTFLTVFDLMVWHFDANGVNKLMAFRFVASILYAFTRGVVTRKHQQPTPVTPAAIDVDELVSKALEKVTSDQAQVNQQLLTALEEVKTAQALPQILPPPVDPALLVQAATEEILRQVETRFQALDTAIFRQNTTIVQAPEIRQISGKVLPEKSVSVQAEKPDIQAERRPAKKAVQAEQNVIRLVPANTSRDEMRAEAIRLHEGGMSSYKIAEKIGKSAKTVQSWLNKDRIQADESEVNEAVN